MPKFTWILAQLVYGLMAAAYLAAGTTTLLINTGLVPDSVREVVLQFSQNNLGFLHIIQELGTLLVLVGLVLVWCILHYEQSRYFHWALTAYWAIMAVIHWFNVAGPWESVVGPLINTVPVVVFLTIGILREANEGRTAAPAPPVREEQVAGAR